MLTNPYVHYFRLGFRDVGYGIGALLHQDPRHFLNGASCILQSRVSSDTGLLWKLISPEHKSLENDCSPSPLAGSKPGTNSTPQNHPKPQTLIPKPPREPTTAWRKNVYPRACPGSVHGSMGHLHFPVPGFLWSNFFRVFITNTCRLT